MRMFDVQGIEITALPTSCARVETSDCCAAANRDRLDEDRIRSPPSDESSASVEVTLLRHCQP